jgi:outer membrane lipoprotein carrier protein
MMRKMMIMLLLLVNAPLTTLRADEPAEELLEKVRKKYDTIADAQLKFSQRVTFGVSKIEQKTNGTLFLKKQNMYRLELNDQTIVTNGKTVWSHSVSNNQVLIDNFKVDERSLTPERILTGAPADFSATVIGSEKSGKTDVVVLKLVPKEEGSIVKSLKLWVDESTWLIKNVEVVDVNGKETEYMVNELHVNVGLKDSRFNYVIPEGVEVVDLR